MVWNAKKQTLGRVFNNCFRKQLGCIQQSIIYVLQTGVPAPALSSATLPDLVCIMSQMCIKGDSTHPCAGEYPVHRETAAVCWHPCLHTS